VSGARSPQVSAGLLVVAADRRMVSAAAGFLEPAGIAVTPFLYVPSCPAEAVAAAFPARAEAGAIALVDWELTGAEGAHLGAELRRLRPGIWLIAVVEAGIARAQPAGWDAMVHLPLVRDPLLRAVEEGMARHA